MTLFERNKRSVELTPVGERYLVSINQALNGIDVATHDIASISNTDTVSINVAPNFLIRWLIPNLSMFQKRYPDVILHINSSNETADLVKTNMDMAVYFGHGDWHELEVELLFKVCLVPVYNKTLVSKKYPLQSPQDLQQYPLIHVSKRLYEWPEWLGLSNIDYAGFSRGLQLSSSQLATTAAQEGLGVALADRTLSAREIKSGKLIKPFDIVLDSQRSFYLVHSKNTPVTHGMRVFKDWLLEELHSKTAGV